MTLRTHNRLILIGFVLAYCGVMGTLASLSFEHGSLAIGFLLLPLAVLGLALIAMAKLSPVRDCIP